MMEPLVAGYPRAVEAMVNNRPWTLVHGTYRPIQIILDTGEQPPRLCPVDWEKAGVGSCFFDLAFLADGFDPVRLAQLFEAYRSDGGGGWAAGLRPGGDEVPGGLPPAAPHHELDQRVPGAELPGKQGHQAAGHGRAGRPSGPGGLRAMPTAPDSPAAGHEARLRRTVEGLLAGPRAGPCA